MARDTIRCEHTHANGMGRDTTLQEACRTPARRFVRPIGRSVLHIGFFCSAEHGESYAEYLTRTGYEVDTGPLALWPFVTARAVSLGPATPLT